MATKIEKFVFEMSAPKNPYDESDESDDENEGASYTDGGIVQDFPMNADSRVLYVKINSAGYPAFYAMVDDNAPLVTRRFAAYPSRVSLPPNWVHVGSSCNGHATYHVGEVLVSN